MTADDPKPPLSSTRHRLSFDLLSPADFERLCLWLVRREGFESVQYLGEAGSDQGRDLTARREGRRFAFQCKRVQRFAAAEAKREIDKIRALSASELPDELVFVVTKALSADARRIAQQAWGDDETCHFWCGSELDERVKRHDEILVEFFDAAGDPVSSGGFQAFVLGEPWASLIGDGPFDFTPEGVKLLDPLLVRFSLDLRLSSLQIPTSLRWELVSVEPNVLPKDMELSDVTTSLWLRPAGDDHRTRSTVQQPFFVEKGATCDLTVNFELPFSVERVEHEEVAMDRLKRLNVRYHLRDEAAGPLFQSDYCFSLSQLHGRLVGQACERIPPRFRHHRQDTSSLMEEVLEIAKRYWMGRSHSDPNSG